MKYGTFMMVLHCICMSSALMGFIQMGLSAGATALVGHYLIDTPQPMLDFMFLISIAALILAIWLHRVHTATRH